MTTTFQNTYTPLPTKTNEMTWDNFSSLILSAYEAERQRLTEVIPTPPITATSGEFGTGRSDEWMEQYQAQQNADRERTAELTKYEAQLIASIAEALEASVPLFKELYVGYEGSGDQGEDCDISVELERGYEPTMKTSWGTPCWTDEQNEEFRAREKAAYDLLPSDLISWMDEICWSLAYQQHPGFEIDDGGFGTITVKRDEAGVMKVSLEHTDRIESTEEYEPQELN